MNRNTNRNRNSNRKLRNILLISGGSMLTTFTAHADTLYWDVNGSAIAGFGTVVGGWNGTNAFWNTDSTGSNLGSVQAGTTSADDLIISQATTNTGSITVTGARLASSITFATNVGPTTTITGGTSITIGGSGAFSGIFQQSTGANTVTTPLILNSANSAFAINSTGAGTLTINGSMTGSASIGNTQTINVSSAGGTITLASSAISDGLNGGKVAVVYGTLGGPLVTTALSASNSFSGGFTLNSGIINGIATGTYNGFGTGPVTINGGRLTVNSGANVTFSNAMNWNNTFEFDRGASSTPTVTWAGPITLGANVTVNSSTTAAGANYIHIFNGNILDDVNGNRALAFTTRGTGGRAFVTLNGNNTFTGDLSITRGSLTIGGSGKLGGGDYSGNISITQQSAGGITYSSSSDQILRGNITGIAGLALVKNTSDSVLTLLGTNTYNTGTTVSAGTLTFGKTAAKSSTGTHAFAAGTTLGLGVGGTGFFTATDVTNAFAGTMTGNLAGITVTTTTNVGIDTSAGNFTYGDSIAGSPTKGLTKLGANILTLTGTNTYTGATTVTAGTLLINGDSSGATGAITVDAGATLGGTGTIGGATTISGVHSPGTSPGVQIFLSDLSYTDNSSVVWELVANTNSIGTRGTAYDGINVGGALVFGDPTTLNLNFNFGSSAVEWDNVFWENNYTGTNGWLVYSGATSLTGYDNLTLNLPTAWLDENGDTLASSRVNGTFVLFQDGNNIYLNYTNVPEPTTALLGGLGLLALLRRRRD